MGFQDYIGETEACAYAGVSATTLRRFAEAGYFQIETDSDGLRLFSKTEIESLFGLKPLASSRARMSPPAPAQRAAPSPDNQPSAPAQTAAIASPTPTADGSATAQLGRTATTVVRAAVEVVTPIPPRVTLESTREGVPPVSVTGPAALGPAMEPLEQEVTKLRNVVSLQEKLLDLREEEVRNLKGERDWLRSRIERLEEKNERDQLLLLAETQTVRQLVTLQQRKRSGVIVALEWLGFKSPSQPQGQPIDISPTPTRTGP